MGIYWREINSSVTKDGKFYGKLHPEQGRWSEVLWRFLMFFQSESEGRRKVSTALGKSTWAVLGLALLVWFSGSVFETLTFAPDHKLDLAP